jgi:lactate dehydrogenase-like 2-hydroxyacid dehydrogenase
LAEALHAEQLFAGLDVYEEEPRVHPSLLHAPGTVLLPHIGSATTRARTAMAQMALRSARAALTGEIPATALNPEAWAGRQGARF